MIRLDPHFDIRQKRECPWYQHVITITIFLCRFDSHWFLLIPILSPLVPPDNPIVSHEFSWSPTISSWNITVFLSGRVLPVCLLYHDDFPWISMNSQQFPLFHPDFQSKIPAWPPASLRLRCATLPRLPLTVWGSWPRSTTAWRQLRIAPLRIADEGIWMCLGIIQVDVFYGKIMKNPCSQLRLMEKLESWKIWRKNQA